MAYSVEHIRFTLTCDACGLVEKRDLEKDDQRGTQGWYSVCNANDSVFCCPSCAALVNDILYKKLREKNAAEQAKIENCDHEYQRRDYQRRGFLMQCSKCGKFS